jgi:hypothetical protein
VRFGIALRWISIQVNAEYRLWAGKIEQFLQFAISDHVNLL